MIESVTSVLIGLEVHSCTHLQDLDRVQRLHGRHENYRFYLCAMIEHVPLHLGYAMVQYIAHQASDT